MSDRMTQKEIEELTGESLEDMGLEEAFETDEYQAEFPGDATLCGRILP